MAVALMRINDRLIHGQVMAGWLRVTGATVYYSISSLGGLTCVPGLSVVPLVGGAGAYQQKMQVNETARVAAEKLGGTCRFFMVPYLSPARI